MKVNSSVEAGQAVYSKNVLSLYDLWVLGFSNTFLWKCPTKSLRDTFSLHVSLNHLDVGVGTGYYLEKCLSDTGRRIALLDLNQNSLDAAAARISRFSPEVYRANILEPLELDCEKFDSISINYLLHCLPGSMLEKSAVFSHLREHLKADGILFGSTILGQETETGYFARKLMAVYNKKGIFDNTRDNVTDLRTALCKHFSQVEIRIIGCVAVFTAKV